MALRTLLRSIALLAVVASPGAQRAPSALIWGGAHEVERVPGELTLCTFGGAGGDVGVGAPGYVLLLDDQRRIVHFWPVATHQTHSAFPTKTHGNVLITDWLRSRVVEATADGSIVWDTDALALSDGSQLKNPNDARELAGGQILISDLANHRLLEIDRAGNVLWQYGTTGVVGICHFPHSPHRRANGNTIFTNSGRNEALEIDPSGQIVWQYFGSGATTMSFPRDSDPLASGAIAIGDASNFRIQVVDQALGYQFEIPLPSRVYDCDELPSGNFLVGGQNVYEVDGSGNVLWKFPQQRSTTLQQPLVVNPSSGVALDVRVLVPSSASPTNPASAIVLVPDMTDDQTTLDARAVLLASEGHIAVTWDPDGRGGSTAGGTYTTEDYGGHLHQDGLHQVLLAVAARADVDPKGLVVASFGYGNTLASGCLARHANDPPVRLFRDWEGPATRAETALSAGGFIPRALTDNPFWAEREALAYMPSVRAAFVRAQSAVDHAPLTHPTNFHALDLTNAATHVDFGGGGSSPRTRVSSFILNDPDRIWSAAAPPRWVDEAIELEIIEATLLMLDVERELRTPHLDVVGSVALGATVTFTLDARAAWAGDLWALTLSGPLAPLQAPAALILALGFLDANGDAAQPFVVPNLPILSGLTFFLQGTVVRPDEPIPWISSEFYRAAIP